MSKEDTRKKLEEKFLTWVMANRDVSSRRWKDVIEPELLKQLAALIEQEKTEVAKLAFEDGRSEMFRMLTKSAKSSYSKETSTYTLIIPKENFLKGQASLTEGSKG